MCDWQGRFTIAAKHHMTIAEIYESELVDIEKVPIAFKHLLDAVLCVISPQKMQLKVNVTVLYVVMSF